jgi:hypothetical protein
LWGVGLAEINTPWHWIAGFGLGATRVLFASSVTWAGDAHSAWLELLLSLGLLGLVAGISLVVATGLRLFRQAGDAVLPVLFIYIVVMSPVGSGFGAPGPGPGLGFGLLAFAYAARAAARRTADEHAPLRRVGLQSELRSAPT